MRRAVRIVARSLAAIAALVVVLAIALYAASEIKLGRRHELPRHTPFLGLATPDSTVVARGRHLTGPIAKCVDCHGDDFSGRVFLDGEPFGRFVGPNLTRGAGGVGATLTDADFE